MRKARMIFALVGFISLFQGTSSANQEITVALPGGVRMEFVWIEPGIFLMGSPSTDVERNDDETPQHEVTISKGFFLGKYEITQEQWTSVMGNNPAAFAFFEDSPKRPVDQISWYDVQAFVHTLNTAAGDSLYRLPTEAEWEYACRAGTTTPHPVSANDDPRDYGWIAPNNCPQNCYPQVVGTKKPNLWGLFDMQGNVTEWCQDWYGDYYSGPQIDPSGPESGIYRVWRGSSYGTNTIAWMRSAARIRDYPEGSGPGLGARIVRIESKITIVTPQSWGQTKKESR